MATAPKLKDVLQVKGGDLDGIRQALLVLANQEVLVGFPEDTTVREDMGIDGMTNAAIAYIHDNGAPEQNLPARPFMIPGIDAARDKLAEALGAGAKRVLRDKNAVAAIQTLHRVGIIAMTSIKKTINSGVPPPLAEMTLRERIRKGSKTGQKSAKKELESRAQGNAPSTEFAKPLVDSGALRNATNYVIRPRSARKP